MSVITGNTSPITASVRTLDLDTDAGSPAWTSSDTDVMTVNASTGVVTLQQAAGGVATIADGGTDSEVVEFLARTVVYTVGAASDLGSTFTVPIALASVSDGYTSYPDILPAVSAVANCTLTGVTGTGPWVATFSKGASEPYTILVNGVESQALGDTMGNHANMVEMTVTSVASAGTGTITLNAARSGFQSLGDYYGGDATVPGVRVTEGTAWETFTNAAYTHSGTTLTRGTFDDSSTGAAVAFTSAAVVAVTATARNARRWDSAALESVAASVTTADVTGVVGQISELDISGLTAARSFILPTGAEVNSMCGFRITAGYTAANYDRGLKYTAGTAETLNGVAAGTEVSRCFMTNELMIFKCTASGVWKVERDGRIPQRAMMWLSTAASGEGVNTFAKPTAQSGAWTKTAPGSDNASIAVTADGEIRCRRVCQANMAVFGLSTNILGAAKFFTVALYLNGTTNILFASTLSNSSATVGQQAGGIVEGYTLAVGDYIVYQYRSEEGSKGLAASTSPRVISYFSLTEQLS